MNRLIAAEPLVTEYDTVVGDGDCGVGLKRGAEAILAFLNNPSTSLTDDLVSTVNKIIPVVENTMDGTSGAIYAIFLNALAHGLREQASPDQTTPITPQLWAGALRHSLTALGRYTPAKPGDRTLVDALTPFVQHFGETADLKAAAQAAENGSTATKDMKPGLGRSVYVGGESDWLGKIPDPGAYGLSEFLKGLADAN